MKTRFVWILPALALLPLAAAAESVTVHVINHQPAGGFTISPVWVAVHDGTFDSFDSGAAASPGIEAIAELADAGPIAGEFAASGASGVGGVATSPLDPPPIIPGENAMVALDVGDATVNRYFSFASMLVPSNDFFFGNGNQLAHEVFDAAGNFLGPVTIELYSDDAWDAGTEVNDLSDGPAFLVGQDATLGTPEDGVITPLFDVPGVEAYLAAIVGLETPIGTLTDPLATGELVATIEIVPEPGTLALAAAGLGLLVRRRA